MTPPALKTNLMAATMGPSTDVAAALDVDMVSELSFDDLRELPMHMQLGLDLSALD
ncbi:MAG: hypothetical protein ACR2P0_08440 [Acidimicrobiales bacterium]